MGILSIVLGAMSIGLLFFGLLFFVATLVNKEKNDMSVGAWTAIIGAIMLFVVIAVNV